MKADLFHFMALYKSTKAIDLYRARKRRTSVSIDEENINVPAASAFLPMKALRMRLPRLRSITACQDEGNGA